MRIEAPPFEYDASPLDASRHASLDVRDLTRPLADA
jgi:hypothetical protein